MPIGDALYTVCSVGGDFHDSACPREVVGHGGESGSEDSSNLAT